MTTPHLIHDDIIGKLRRRHRHARTRNPRPPALRRHARPALRWRAGQLTIEIPTVGGGSVAYSAAPIVTWRFKLIDCDPGIGAAASVRSRVIDAATIDRALDMLVALEREALAAQPASIAAE